MIEQTKENDVRYLTTLFFESWAYPSSATNINLEDFAKNLFKEQELYDFRQVDKNEERALNGEEPLSDEEMLLDFEDAAHSQQAALLIIYLYRNDYLSREDLKELLDGTRWRTSVHGQWHKYMAEEFGISINEDQ